jgi:hypothetical protein
MADVLVARHCCSLINTIVCVLLSSLRLCMVLVISDFIE